MLDTATGRVHLAHNEFSLHPLLSHRELEQLAKDQISFRYETDNHYLHIYLWLEEAPGVYIHTGLCFHDERLVFIEFYPQYVAAAPEGNPSPMDDREAQVIVRAWYGVHFSRDQSTFPWGSVHCFLGSDPIYYPPRVRISYT